MNMYTCMLYLERACHGLNTSVSRAVARQIEKSDSRVFLERERQSEKTFIANFVVAQRLKNSKITNNIVDHVGARKQSSEERVSDLM